MKDEIDISECRKQREVKAVIDDRMDYYNSERYKKNVLDKGYSLQRGDMGMNQEKERNMKKDMNQEKGKREEKERKD